MLAVGPKLVLERQQLYRRCHQTVLQPFFVFRSSLVALPVSGQPVLALVPLPGRRMARELPEVELEDQA